MKKQMCSVTGLVFFFLLCFQVPAWSITVHDYTNVTLDPGHLLVVEGTRGATLIAGNGEARDGLGGSDEFPLDDKFRLFVSTPVGNANAFDRYWFQIEGEGAFLTFDLGASFEQAYIALSQDHGPYPAEGLEYRLAVSNDNATFFPLALDTPITVFRRGWSAAGEPVICGPGGAEPCGQPFDGNMSTADVLNDDFSALWTFPDTFRYVRLAPISDNSPFNEPEVDAVMGVSKPVPEPATLWFLGAGLACLGAMRRFRTAS